MLTPLPSPTVLQGIWTRCFPATEELKSVLGQGTVGDVRMARAEMGLKLSLARSTDWAQAGGALLDVGIYCVQFISMVFGGQRPEKILAVGRIHETGAMARTCMVAEEGAVPRPKLGQDSG